MRHTDQVRSEPEIPKGVAVAAWGVAVAAVACVVATLVLHARNAAALRSTSDLYLADVWIAMLVPAVGAYLITRARRLLLGSVLLSTALLALGGVTGTAATFLTAVRGVDGPVPATLTWIATWTWTPYLLLPTVVPVLFPDGRPGSRRWAAVAATIASVVLAITVLSAFSPGPIGPFPLLENPLDGPEWIASILGVLIPAVVLIGTPLSLISVFIRWRAAGPATRQRVGWLVAAVAFLVVAVITQDQLAYPWGDVVLALGFTAVIGAVALAAVAERGALQLQMSREQLVVARESERLRLHRDLHDGLGPELAGMALQLHAIGEQVDDPDLRERLSEAEAAMRGTVAEVRRIVEDLRPPALDDLGLRGAITERAHALGNAAGIPIDVEAPRELGDIPAAVEVAAYRIAVEAMTNTVRHAGASRCHVRLRPDNGQLHVEVSDDGRGSIGPRPGGIGLGSMRARAEEIGGKLAFGRSSLGGASLQAWLPLAPR